MSVRGGGRHQADLAAVPLRVPNTRSPSRHAGSALSRLAAWCWQIGAVHLLRARADEAVRWLEKARSAHAGLHFIHAYLAAGYALKGETGRASVALDEAHRLSDRYSSIARLKAAPGRQWLAEPRIRALAEPTFFAGLRKAGMPEE